VEFVEEVVVEEFLPTVRSMLAEELRERGLTQHEVAELLGISQSAVSKYAHGEVTRESRIVEDDRVGQLVDEIAGGLAAGEMRPVQALVELEVLIRELEQGDLLAELHQERVPELTEYGGDFAVHDPDSELRTAEQTLTSLRRGLSILERTSGFAAHIPAVGSNLVVCLTEARTIDDVAGIPGRILDVKGRATVPADPEFGVSEHVATILLAARAGGSDARAAINVAYDPELLEWLDDEEIPAIEFDAEADPDVALVAALDGPSDRVETDAGTADPTTEGAGIDGERLAVYQTGGFGIEPIIYLLGPDAETLARTVRRLCQR
jgi:predicted fused transcriptional regulator/phosphomethylpyrimidine kinase/predicted transcriptional regulator